MSPPSKDPDDINEETILDDDVEEHVVHGASPRQKLQAIVDQSLLATSLLRAPNKQHWR